MLNGVKHLSRGEGRPRPAFRSPRHNGPGPVPYTRDYWLGSYLNAYLKNK